MKLLTDSKESYGRFWQMLMAAMPSEILISAIETGVFDFLEQFRSPTEVARQLDTHPENTRRFLDSMVTINLLEKKNGHYRNLPDTQAFLAQNSPRYLGAMLRFSRDICINPLRNLSVLLREGPRPGTDMGDEKIWAEAARGSAAWVLGDVGVTLTGIISRLDGFSAFEKMLDLGGGHGMFTLYFVQAHPSMTGVVFDRPAITPVAHDFIKEYGMEARIEAVSGDYLNDPIGSGYDLIWASSTLNFARTTLEPLVHKIHTALKPGGYFIAFQDGLTHEHTKPDVTLGFLPAALQSDIDYGFYQGEIAETMSRTGFKSVRSRSIQTPMGIMDLDIARK